MTARLTYPTSEQIAAMGRDPAPVRCTDCGEEIWGSYGLDHRPYCRDCIDRAAWLAEAHGQTDEVRRAG